MKPTQHIVKEYRKQRGLSLRKFADDLIENTNHGIEISHQSIKNWEDGVTEPEFSFVMMMALTGRGWRMDFAFDVLAAMRPEIYEPMTKIGRDALELATVEKEK